MSSNWAGTILGGIVMGSEGRAELEVFYTISPGGDSGPRMQMAGLIVGARGSPDVPVSIVASIGAGVIEVDDDDRLSCGPPICFGEGGPSFRDARLATVIGAFGVDVPLAGPTRLRFDARGHLPLGGDDSIGNSGDVRLEVGVGFRVLFR